MEKEQRQAKLSVKKFSYALNEAEKSIRPLLSALDTLRSSSNEGELDALSRARLHITMCYTINSLFVMYLRTQGMDPLSHPVSDEIERVQEAFMRFRKVEAGISTDYQAPPDRDRRKHIVNTKKATTKLASSILPEEALLVAALKGDGRKRKREDDDADDTGIQNGGEKVEIISDDEQDEDAQMKDQSDMEKESSEEEPSAKKKKKKDKKEKKDRKNKKAKKEKSSMKEDEGEEETEKVIDSGKETKTPKDKKKKKKKDKKRKSS